jgi:hypothetical protein
MYEASGNHSHITTAMADAHTLGGQYPRGGTVLHAALYNGHPELAPLLLKYNADVTAQGEKMHWHSQLL